MIDLERQIEQSAIRDAIAAKTADAFTEIRNAFASFRVTLQLLERSSDARPEASRTAPRIK